MLSIFRLNKFFIYILGLFFINNVLANTEYKVVDPNIIIESKKINNFLKKNDNIKNTEEQEFERQAQILAQNLQNVLASKLLDSMYEGIDNNSVIGVSSGEKMFRSMLNDARAKNLDLKLVEPIKRQILLQRKNTSDGIIP